MKPKKIAIIGSGISALTIAKKLSTHCEIKLFEKSFKPGGRLATRRLEETPVDFGAPFFTAISDDFQSFLKPAISAKAVLPWDCVVEEELAAATNRFVGSPTMRSLAEFYASDCDVSYQTNITSCEKKRDGWRLVDTHENYFGGFDWLISTAPFTQSMVLLKSEDIIKKIKIEEMDSAFCLMLILKKPPPVPWQLAHVKSKQISWVSICSSKPNRTGQFSAVIASTDNFANQNLDKKPKEIKAKLLENALEILQLTDDSVLISDLHRWRYANARRPSEAQFYMDEKTHLALCGDWCTGGSVEGAFLSSSLLSEKLKELI